MQADLIPVPSTLLDRLVALGVDLAEVLRLARIPPSRLQPPKGHLATREIFAFWNAVEQVSGTRDVGLRIGGEAQPHQYNVASIAALHSPTLGEALNRLARYKRLVCPEEVVIERARGEARIEFQWLLAEERLPTFLVDGTFASVVALARQGTGRAITPRRLELTRRRADEAMLARHFGCEIRFERPADRLILDERALDEPFRTHNADLLEVLLPGLEAALDEHAGGRTLADDVRAILGRRMSGERPSVEKIAEELRLSTRTLQRRLGELGTTYQALLDEVRQKAARRLLSSTDLDAGEVAFLLGFEELNSFTRAFHAWEGMTPTRWRGSERSRSL